jgi:phosphotransferase system HPr (HPr) family protein
MKYTCKIGIYKGCRVAFLRKWMYIIGHGLFYSTISGKPMETVLEQEVTVLSEMGLHTRPAAQLAKMASAFNATVFLSRWEDPATETECSSILGLLMLAAPQGAKLRLKATGTDAENAIRCVAEYFSDGFGDERD